MAKNFKDWQSIPVVNMTHSQAMIYLINFFNSRMSVFNKRDTDRVQEIISFHEISVSDLINKYVELVHENS
jgi:hypothetical protein